MEEITHRPHKCAFPYYRDTCQYCDKVGRRNHIEHIVPVKRGGKQCISNLILACLPCNGRKLHHLLQPKEQRKAIALAVQAAPEIMRCFKMSESEKWRNRQRLRSEDNRTARKLSEKREKAILQRVLRPQSHDKVDKIQEMHWGILILLSSKAGRKKQIEGLAVVEGVRCGWDNRSIVMVVRINPQTDVFDTPVVYTSDSNPDVALSPYLGRMPRYATRWIKDNRENFLEDIWILYRGSGSRSDFHFRRGKELPRPRLRLAL